MKILNNYSEFYCSPTVDVMTVQTEGVLCTSSGELDDLQKNAFDFDWEN